MGRLRAVPCQHFEVLILQRESCRVANRDGRLWQKRESTPTVRINRWLSEDAIGIAVVSFFLELGLIF